MKKNLIQTEVRTFAFDFTAQTLEEYTPLFRALESLEIGVLVNNVGMSYDYPDVSIRNYKTERKQKIVFMV